MKTSKIKTLNTVITWDLIGPQDDDKIYFSLNSKVIAEGKN